MSLYRQLWITVTACMALCFVVSFVISAFGARSYLEQQLAVKNTDAAGALALSMSQLPKDRGTLELQVATLFESGQYELVRVRGQDGKTVVELRDRQPAPSFIAALLPVSPKVGRAEIADGATVFGSIELESVRTSAYEQLQRIALQLAAGFLLAGLATGWLCTLVLDRIRRHLGVIVQQARAIAERRFVPVPEPRAPELSEVARAMNQMVERLRQMFQEGARQLEHLRHVANHDALTGLATRAFFLNRLSLALDAEATPAGGVLLLCRVRDLAGINRVAGRDTADALLVKLAQLIIVRAGRETPETDAIGGRLNGADLTLLLPGGDAARAEADTLAAAIEGAGLATLAGSPAVAAIAAVRYEAGESCTAVLARADAALARAEALPGNAVAADEEKTGADILSADAWRQRLLAAIGQKRMRLARFPVRANDGALLHRECYVRLDLHGSGEWVPAGHFMAMVSRLGLAAEFDLAVAHVLMGALCGGDEALALNLAADSLAVPDFVPGLLALLDRAPVDLPRLWVEIPADGAVRHPRAFAALVQGLHARGCKVGVERFGRQFDGIASFYGLGLDYVKIDPGFIRDVARSPGNRHFLKSVCAVIHGLGCQALAEGVRDAAELAVLPGLGFDGAGGPAVER